MHKKLIKSAAIHSLGVVAYVSLVAGLMQFITKHLSNKPDTVFAPMTVLLLLVTSAAITGYLVLGQPLMLYLDGKKSEAAKQFGYNLIFMLIFTLLAVAGNFIMS